MRPQSDIFSERTSVNGAPKNLCPNALMMLQKAMNFNARRFAVAPMMDWTDRA
jgi:hypothetical protein